MSPHSSRIDKWQRWIHRITREVGTAIADRRTWHEVRQLWKSNPALDVPSEIPPWIARMYSGSALLLLRRQMDTHDDVVSLARLIREVAEHSSLLTRGWYETSCVPPGLRGVVRDTFAKWTDGSGSELDPRIPMRDLRRLLVAGATARRFANKVVAHTTKATVRESVTFGEIDRLLLRVERLTLKYYALLTGGGMIDNTLVPVRQFNHETILRRPWLQPHWRKVRWPSGWMERMAENWPILDWLPWGEYLRLRAARESVRGRLIELVKPLAPLESPIRTVLAELGLPSSDAAVALMRDSLMMHGQSWRGGAAREA